MWRAFEAFGERIFTPGVLLAFFTFINCMTYYDRGALSAAIVECPSISSDPWIVEGVNTTNCVEWDAAHAKDRSYGLSESKSGFLGSAFMGGFMVFCPLFANLSDRISPLVCITLGQLLWIGAALTCAFSPSYEVLAFGRVLVGAGEASFAGIAPRIIDDSSPPESRSTRLGLFYAMIPVGTAIGYVLGGAITHNVRIDALGHFGEGWRVAFLGEALIVLPLCVIVLAVPRKYLKPAQHLLRESADGDSACPIDDPLASFGGMKGQQSAEMSSCVDEGAMLPAGLKVDHAVLHSPPFPLCGRGVSTDQTKVYTFVGAVQALFTNKHWMLVVFGQSCYVAVIGALGFWGIKFAVEVGMGKSLGPVVMGGITVVAGLSGTAFGGKMLDVLGGTTGTAGFMRCTMWCFFAMLVSFPLLMACYIVSPWSWKVCTVFIFVAQFAMFSINAPISVALLTCVPASLRTYAMSFNVFVIHVIGDFPSPFAVGWLSEYIFGGSVRLALEAASFWLLACVGAFGVALLHGLIVHRDQLSLRTAASLASYSQPATS